jgi:PPOX class probable F420-dependent enzyme
MENRQNDLSEFAAKKYMNIETYRRSGEAIRTPVWFVESGGILFFLTRGDSGKVKRLRHNKQVRVAPCKVNGDLTGDWTAGTASMVDSMEVMQVVKDLFDDKYGAVSRLTNVFSRMQRKKRVFVKVIPGNE